MAKDSTQLEMFSLEGEAKKKRKRESHPLQPAINISRRVLLYIVLGGIIIMGIVYVAGVEQGRRWKIDRIYKEYIQGQELEKK
jgi:hypothetical protein